MFFKEIKLKRNHWSYRLLHWAFPNIPRFNNFCPHFWLTILAAFLSPFLLILDVIMRTAMFLTKYLDEKHTSKYQKLVKEVASELNNYTDHDIKVAMAIRYNYRYVDKCKLGIYKRLVKILDILYINNDKSLVDQGIRERYAKIKNEFISENYTSEKYCGPYFKRTKEEKEPIKNKPWWPKLIKVSKVLFILILLLILYPVIKLIGWCFYWIGYFFMHINYAAVGLFLLKFFTIIVIGIILAAIILLLVKLFRRISLPTLPSIGLMCHIKSAVRTFFKPIVFIAKVIKEVCIFLWEGIKLFEKNNCPGIIWVDEEK